jgi:predicted nucleotide-binding protein
MTFMNPLEAEILKYEKKGFDAVQKRTLKFGKRIFLKKEIEGFLSSGFEGIYIYYHEGDSTPESIRDCLKDYVRFFEDEEFGEGDKGFYMVSGSADEKLFKDLKKIVIEDNDVRNSIKPLASNETETEQKPMQAKTVKKIFIAHGRDKTPALEIARFLEKKYPIEVIILEEQAHRGETIIEKLEKYSDVNFAFITLTPDDVGALKGEPLKERGRHKLIFEWGQFIGKIGRRNVCLIVKGDVEIPSDLAGIGRYCFIKNVKECFSDIEDELRDAK